MTAPKCTWCGEEQKDGELFANGMHLSCHVMSRTFAALQKLSWGKVPDELLADVISSPVAQTDSGGKGKDMNPKIEQLNRMAEKYARFDRLVSEHLIDYKAGLARPCPKCGQLIEPGEKCPVCRRGKI